MHESDHRMLVLDTETTGTDPRRDQIIELSIQSGLTNASPTKTWRIKPTVPIHPEAQALHGIGMNDLAECKPFAAHAACIRQRIEGASM